MVQDEIPDRMDSSSGSSGYYNRLNISDDSSNAEGRFEEIKENNFSSDEESLGDNSPVIRRLRRRRSDEDVYQRRRSPSEVLNEAMVEFD